VLLERVYCDLDAGGEVLLGRSDALLRQVQAGEEADRAALHDGQQHAVLGAEVVVDRAEGDGTPDALTSADTVAAS
jgi:hypothetical protein